MPWAPPVRICDGLEVDLSSDEHFEIEVEHDAPSWDAPGNTDFRYLFLTEEQAKGLRDALSRWLETKSDGGEGLR